MASVAGVDFGTQSVRVAIVDSERGTLAAAVAEYPVKRDRNDPDFATHGDEKMLRVVHKEPEGGRPAPRPVNKPAGATAKGG